MQRLQSVKATPNRVQSKGVIVMSDRWKTKTATNALIQADVAAFPHIPIQRKFATSDGHEAGFLCVGQNTITFLSTDNVTVIASHPLAFLESYCQDIHNPKIFTYTLMQKHMLSVLKKDELLSFNFLSDSEAKVKGIVAVLDQYVTISSRGKTEKVLPQISSCLF